MTTNNELTLETLDEGIRIVEEADVITTDNHIEAVVILEEAETEISKLLSDTPDTISIGKSPRKLLEEALTLVQAAKRKLLGYEAASKPAFVPFTGVTGTGTPWAVPTYPTWQQYAATHATRTTAGGHWGNLAEPQQNTLARWHDLEDNNG